MMKIISKKKELLALVILIFAILYKVEYKTDYWTSLQWTTVDGTEEETIAFITHADHVEKWFTWISHLYSADSRPLGVNKKYHVVYDVPIIGEVKFLFKMVEYESKKKIVLESDSFLKPQIEINLKRKAYRRTIVSMKIGYRRYSLLFHILVAPWLSIITDQRMKQALFGLRVFFPL